MSNYSWLNEAFAWLGPVAVQAREVTFCRDRVFAFAGAAAVAEYTAPTPLPVDEPIAVSYQAIKTIDWSGVTSFKVGKSLELGLYGGTVRLPQAASLFDPPPILTEGVAYPAADFKVALAAVLPAVARDVAGSWQGNVHIQGDLVAGTTSGSTSMRFVTLPYELSHQAEVPYDAAKMLASLPLDDEAEVYFDGSLDIIGVKTVKGKRVEEVVGQSFAGMTVVSGRGSLRVPLAHSTPIDMRGYIKTQLDASTHHVNISPELGNLLRTINALKGMGSYPYVILSFGDDGATVNSAHVEQAVVAAEYADNAIPPYGVRVQTGMLDVTAREWLRLGLSGELSPVIIHDDNATTLVMPMKPVEEKAQ